MASHGYTLISKGTVPQLVVDLEHEERIYSKLKTLQGSIVPVCLGFLNLSVPYYYDIGVEITGLLLLSWGGGPLPDEIQAAIKEDEWWNHESVKTSIDAVWACGVLHEDSRAPNLLWDEKGKRVVVIDFERAKIIKSKIEEKAKLKGLGTNTRNAPAIAERKRKWVGSTKKKMDRTLVNMSGLDTSTESI